MIMDLKVSPRNNVLGKITKSNFTVQVKSLLHTMVLIHDQVIVD